MTLYLKYLKSFCLLFFFSSLLSHAALEKKSSPYKYKENSDWYIKTPPLSYKKALFYSLIVPGGGHLYTERYVRSGFLIGLELTLTIDAFGNNTSIISKAKRDASELRKRSFNHLNDYLDTTNSQRNTALNSYFNDQASARLREDNFMEIQTLQRSEISWLIGLHFYGVMDALNIVYHSKKPKPPKTMWSGALYRSLLLPGLGQIYNREFGKFGMLWMAMGNFISSAIFRQQVVTYYLDRKRELLLDTVNIFSLTNSSNFNSQSKIVNNQLIDIRKNRNQYIWGLVMLYLYSIGDSVVDALLQDFNHPSSFAFVPGNTPFHFIFVKNF